MMWLWWSLLLLVQAASFTWTSRARNSGSLVYSGVASVFSNGIWFFGQMFIVDQFMRARTTGDMKSIVFAAMFYTFWMVIGTVAAQHFLRTYIEKGTRKVGA